MREMRDDDVRASCFAALDVLRAQFGDELRYLGALDRGFSYRGARVPFLSPQKGIFRAAAQRGPAALSINTSSKSPYDDEVTEDGFLYAYRDGPVNQPDNRALRAAHELAAPIVYFVASRPGYYRANYPCFIDADLPAERRVLVTPGKMIGPLDEREPVPLVDVMEKRYAVRQTRVRLHQARFRGVVLPAYRERCAVCRLKELRLLDAAHIVADADPLGTPAVSNGLSLCSIHHRAFDEDLVGISPDYVVHVSRRLLEDEDGPMLDVLKGFQGQPIELPRTKAWQPDRDLLAGRFETFCAAS
jgi:putative restriction endonuclease